MNKKIISEIAVGIILLVAIIVGEIFYLQNKKGLQTAKTTSQQARQPEKSEQVSPEKQVSPAITEVANTQDQSTPSLNSVYKDDKYQFSLQLPSNWTVMDRDSFGGPIFLKSPLTEQDVLAKKINNESDCAIPLLVVGHSTDISVESYCKNNIGSVALGNNKFVKCSFRSVLDNQGITSYVIMNPKTRKLFDFSPLQNKDCIDAFNSILSTLTF